MTITPTKSYSYFRKVINTALMPTVLVFSACATATPVYIDTVQKTSSPSDVISAQTLKVQTAVNTNASPTLPLTAKIAPSSQASTKHVTPEPIHTPPTHSIRQMPPSVKTVVLQPSTQMNTVPPRNTIAVSQPQIQSPTKVVLTTQTTSPNILASTPPTPHVVKEITASSVRDISSQYTNIIAGVPIIENPQNCGNGDLEIRVTVSNVKKIKGSIVADLHDDKKENFLVWDKVVLRVRVPVTANEISFCMPLTKSGDYAVAFYHDKNNNAAFDKNFLGIPKERFGMSNNPKFGMKAPKYEQAVFPVSENGADLQIKMLKASDVL